MYFKTHSALNSLRSNDLRTLAREFRFSTSGKRGTLINRLLLKGGGKSEDSGDTSDIPEVPTEAPYEVPKHIFSKSDTDSYRMVGTIKDAMLTNPKFLEKLSYFTLSNLLKTHRRLRNLDPKLKADLNALLIAKRAQALETLRIWVRQQKHWDYTLEDLINLGPLYLSYKKITTIPPEIGLLTHLEVLNLGGNQIKKIPPEIGQLTNLKRLELWRNDITKIPPEIGLLTHLEVLGLYGNQITVIPPEIKKLTNLRQLSLSNNLIKEIPSDRTPSRQQSCCLFGEVSKAKPAPPWGSGQEIGLLTQQHGSFPAGAKPAKQRCNLEFLDLSNNQITEIPPEIGQLTHLEILRLYGNEITEIPPELGQLTNLEYFYLSNNQITEIPPDLFGEVSKAKPAGQEIGQLINLETLYLHKNHITEIPPEIGQLTNLKDFSLSENKITVIPPEIGQLTNLNELYLRGNKITKIPSEIGLLTNLRVFDIYNTQITQIPPNLKRPGLRIFI